MKFSSVTSKLALGQNPQVKIFSQVASGDVVLAEVLTDNPNYPFLEQTDGKLSALQVGDRIVGAIGARQALRGFVGNIPKNINDDKQLALLNLGGVIGHYVDSAVGLGQPVKVKYLGTLIDEQGVVNIKRNTLPPTPSINIPRTIILVLGTCMNVGKTATAETIIKMATQAGYQVGAAKIAGVAAIKDLQCFKQAGAIDVKSFLDCGLPSTVDAGDLSPIVKAIINALQGELLVVELGDGIMGHYNVETVLANKEIMEHVASVIVCAADLTAAYGAKQYLANYGIKINVISGPATDNIAGSDFIQQTLGITAINGCKFPQELFNATVEYVS